MFSLLPLFALYVYQMVVSHAAGTNLTYPFPASVANGSVLLTGVNLPNAGFTANVNGSGEDDGSYPLDTDAQDWFGLGFNFIRYSFNWRFFQADPNNDTLGGRYDQLITNVTDMTHKGAIIIVDCHMYNRFNTNQIIGEAGGLPASALAGMWQKIATNFSDNPNVIFGLMNEPHDEDEQSLFNTMQASVTAIRDTGSEHYILVPNQDYSGMTSFTTNEPTMAMLSDPLNKLIYDIHSYFDENHSGEDGDCLSFDAVQGNYQDVTNLLRQNGRHAILSEFGGTSSSICNETVNEALSFLDENSDCWLGWTAWGALLNPPNSEELGMGQPDQLYLDPNATQFGEISNGIDLVTNALIPHRQPGGFAAIVNNTNGSSLSTQSMSSSIGISSTISTFSSSSNTLASSTGSSSSSSPSPSSADGMVNASKTTLLLIIISCTAIIFVFSY